MLDPNLAHYGADRFVLVDDALQQLLGNGAGVLVFDRPQRRNEAPETAIRNTLAQPPTPPSNLPLEPTWQALKKTSVRQR